MSFTRLRYHVVTTTKGREPWIASEVEEVLYPAMRDRAEALGGRITAIGGIEDHVHMVAAIPPTISVSSIVGKIKGAGSKKVRKTFQELKDFKWQIGFSAFTVSPGDVSRIASYVRNQKARHEHDQLWDSCEQFQGDVADNSEV